MTDSVSRTAGLVLRDHRDRSNPMDLLKVPGPIDIAGTCQSMYVQLYQYQLSQRFYNLCRYPAQHLCCLMSDVALGAVVQPHRPRRHSLRRQGRHAREVHAGEVLRLLHRKPLRLSINHQPARRSAARPRQRVARCSRSALIVLELSHDKCVATILAGVSQSIW
eukprot:COSAG01_NODE_9783_length_2344_cov_15.106013_1_plen_164_part_00